MRTLLHFVSFFIPFTVSLICPPQYFLVNDQKCVKIFWTPATHWEAEQNCTAESGTLVTIKNAIDNRAIVNLLSSTSGINQIWLGLTCFGNSSSSCFWDNGSGNAGIYSNFQANNQFSPPSRCVVIWVSGTYYGDLQGKWASYGCTNGVGNYGLNAMPYLCEVPASEDTGPFNPCRYNFNGYCYYKSEQLLGIGTLVNGTQAKKSCRNYNLTSIHSKMEIDFIRNMYKGSNTSMVYLGAEWRAPDRFNWTDSSIWDFDYRDRLNSTKGKCLVMDVQGYGLWYQVDCALQFEFLCRYQIKPFPPFVQKPIENNFSRKSQTFTDPSHCNSTLYMAPGSMSSFGYPIYTTPPSYCTWQLVALGPYRMGIYFDFWATNGILTIYDEYGTNIGQFSGTYDRTPFPRYTPFNVATVTFEPVVKPGFVDKGFHAVILPL